jgi:Spy/CpxP family protein refolding chaperone
MKHALKLTALAALVAATVFGQAQARQAAGRKAARQQIFQALNLSKEQKLQARTILQNFAQSAKPVAQQLKQNREALAAAVTGNDTPKIKELSTTQGELRGQVLGLRSEAMAKFYAILTPQQRTAAEQARLKLQDLLRKRLGA